MKKVTYAFSDEYPSLCVDKKDILQAQIEACNRLLKYAIDKDDKKAVEKELSELEMSLDLLT